MTGNTINFVNTVGISGTGSALDVTVSGGGALVTFGGAVTIGSLAVTGPAAINGGSVTTTTTQSYTGPVTLPATATTLSGTTITFVGATSTITGTAALNITATTKLTFGGAVNVGSLGVVGATDINGGSVITTGPQNYSGPVTLGANTLITGINVSFAQTIDSDATQRSLEINDSGTTLFGGPIGVKAGTAGITSLTLSNVAGKTTISGGKVRTLVSQTYKNPVTIGVDATELTTVNAGSSIAFSGLVATVDSLDGQQALTINSNVTFDGAVGSSHALKSLIVTGPNGANGGNIVVGGGLIKTNLTQTYNGPLRLANDAAMNAGVVGSFSLVTFNDKLDGTIDGGQGLSVNANAVFNGAVGSAKKLKSLLVAGTSLLNDVSIATSLNQTYNGAMTLNNTNKLSSDNFGNLSFNSIVVGPGGLETTTKGATNFANTVGGGSPLADLKVSTGGPFNLSVDVSTTNEITLEVGRGPSNGDLTIRGPSGGTSQVFSDQGKITLHADDNVALMSNATVTANTGSIEIRGDINGLRTQGTEIMLAGRLNARKAGAHVAVSGNLHNDTMLLSGIFDSPDTSVDGIGGLDTVSVERTLATTTVTNLPTLTRIIGGALPLATVPQGNSIHVNIAAAGGTLDAIQGRMAIEGSPFDLLPPLADDEHDLVTYTVSQAVAGAIPNSSPGSQAVPVGNLVQIIDANRSLSANNSYNLNGSLFQRAGSAEIRLSDPAAPAKAVQTVQLKTGSQGNNVVQIQVPEAASALPLSFIDLDGGQSVATTQSTLRVNAAHSSAIKSTGTINGANVTFNNLIVGDGTVDTGPNGTLLPPIRFKGFHSVGLFGSGEADMIANNSGVPSVFDGQGGGDFLIGPQAKAVIYGGGAPANRQVTIIARGTGGFLLPNTSLDSPNDVSKTGPSFVNANGNNSVAAGKDASVGNATGAVSFTSGKLDVVAWLIARIQRSSTDTLAQASAAAQSTLAAPPSNALTLAPIVVTPTSTLYNTALPQDVNSDQHVTSLDALVVINQLNDASAPVMSASPLAVSAGTVANNHAGTYMCDVSGDGQISPLDVLLVINYLIAAAPASAAPAAQMSTTAMASTQLQAFAQPLASANSQAVSSANAQTTESSFRTSPSLPTLDQAAANAVFALWEGEKTELPGTIRKVLPTDIGRSARREAPETELKKRLSIADVA